MIYLTVAETDHTPIDDHSELSSLNLPGRPDALAVKQGVDIRSGGGGRGGGSGGILVVNNYWSELL